MPESDLAFNLYSTSQTDGALFQYVDTLTGEKGRPEKETKDPELRCIYGAPMAATIFAGRAAIGQTCCNHWNCPACGTKRAKQEYRRIVSGCDALAMGHSLYFWTITCRGRECSYDEAIDGYLLWTNRLFSNARAKAARENKLWCYAQVTEHQKKTRAHPHSHIICTFLPDDTVETKDKNGRKTLVSQWFSRANVSAGLGEQCRISKVNTPQAVSRYVAKYMFKESVNEVWPSGWKRVRYSNNWPKLPEYKPEFVVVLRSANDWHTAEKHAALFVCQTPTDYELARHHIGNILPPQPKLEIVDMSSINV